jgi:hypothetical protein
MVSLRRWLLVPVLRWAVRNGCTNLLQVLLSKRADVNDMTTRDGKTLLDETVLFRQKEMVNLLLTYGAIVNAKNNLCFHAEGSWRYYGGTPLHTAAVWNEDVVQLLLANGADPNAKDLDGHTPLHSAVGYSRRGFKRAVVDLLLIYGADINTKDDDGRTPLHYAASSGYESEVVDLLTRGADPNAKDKYGNTPRDLARGQSGVQVALGFTGAQSLTLTWQPNLQQILSELCEIAARDSYSEEDRKARRSRTRELGHLLHRMGGFELMKVICEVVGSRVGGAGARTIEAWWDGIGSWRG